MDWPYLRGLGSSEKVIASASPFFLWACTIPDIIFEA